MNLLWIFIMTPSSTQKSFSKASPCFFAAFAWTEYSFDRDRFNAVRLFRVISEDSSEQDSLDESFAFLIEGANWLVENAGTLAVKQFYYFTVFYFFGKSGMTGRIGLIKGSLEGSWPEQNFRQSSHNFLFSSLNFSNCDCPCELHLWVFLLRPAGGDPGLDHLQKYFFDGLFFLEWTWPFWNPWKTFHEKNVWFKQRKTRRKVVPSLTPFGAARAAVQLTG